MITKDQRGKLFGLFRDFSFWTGYPIEWVKDVFSMQYQILSGLEWFSLADNRCTLTQANDMIELVLEYMLENGIPFKFQRFHLDSDITRFLFLQLKYRTCFICGKEKSDVAHVEAVGMGNNRKKIDHSKHRFMCLCREHHMEQHQIGVYNFMDKYHIVPLKLNYETLVSLGIQRKESE